MTPQVSLYTAPQLFVTSYKGHARCHKEIICQYTEMLRYGMINVSTKTAIITPISRPTNHKE